jgi:tRNA modification GTPase
VAGDTIFALSSGRPPAAVSVIRISGPNALAAGRAIAGSLPEPRGVALRSLRHPANGEPLDDALVLAFRAPASATGEDVVEFQCHGGRAVVDSVLGALASIGGLRAAVPGEFTRRAFDNGRIDLTEAEGLADLIEAETESQRKAALALAEGGLKRQISDWRERLLALSAEAERAIDYADEDDSSVPRGLGAGCAALASELRDWLNRPRLEPLRDGLKIVVAGPPNTGKSSLINAMAGSDRVIVSDVPGTTRDFVEIPLALDGFPIVLTDTAGLRETADAVEAQGVDRARALTRAADVLLWLGRPSEAPAHNSLIQVHAKADIIAPPDGGEGFAVSAKTGSGIGRLLEGIAERARALLPTEGAIAINRRQAAELALGEHALMEAAAVDDVVIAAESLRAARAAFDRLTGRAGVEDVLDSLFGRFCLGK